MIPVGQEVATYIDFDQFIPGQSVDTCGFAASVLNHYATEVGQPYSASVAQVAAVAAQYYTNYDGPDVPGNNNGMSLEQLGEMIVQLGNHFQNLYPLGGISDPKGAFAGWIAAGYPVIIAITEDSVYDAGIGGKPYAWNTSGYNHIITVTGMATSGNILVRDTANVGRAGPREYDLSRLVIISATVFVPSWLPRPSGATPPSSSPPSSSSQQQAAADNLWNSTNLGLDMKTGIGQSWLAHYVAGVFFGPPLTREYASVDWNGKPITQQVFQSGVANWVNSNMCLWYGLHGLVN